MTIFIYLFTIIVNLLIGFKLKQRTNFIVFYMSLVFVVMLITGYRNTSGFSNDLINYEMEFNNFMLGFTSNYETGYVFLMNIGSYFTDDFYEFKGLVSVILLILLFNSIKRYAPNPHLVISFFSIYLIILSAEQFRYFIAFTVFFLGLIQLIFSEKKYKKAKFLIFTLLASTMHSSFLIYLLFIIIDLNNRKIKKEIFIGAIAIVFSIIVFINGNQIPGIDSFVKRFESEKFGIYLGQSTNFGFLYIVFLQFINIWLSYGMYKFYMKKGNYKNKKIINLIFKINILSILFFPLIMTQITFYRLIRNILIINYFGFSMFLSNSQMSRLNKLIFLICILLSIVMWMYFDLVIKTPSKALLIPFFKENIYFNF